MRPFNLASIPPHVAFVDALAQGLLDRCGADPLALAHTHILLPNRRAVRALTDAFVRLSAGGLLLPRMTPVGDIGDDSFDRFASGDAPIQPAVPALIRRLELARLVRAKPGSEANSAVEALRLGDDLGRALDALLAEEIPPEALASVVANADLAQHWQETLAFLDIVITAWPPARDATGNSDGGTRVAALIDALIARWNTAPPPGLIVAAGITGSSPPLVRLLAAIAGLPDGLIVLPGLDTDSSDAGNARWAAIRCDTAGTRNSEEHPQYALKALLSRLNAHRDDVAPWPVTTPRDGPAARTAAIMAAMAPADAADNWQTPAADAFTGVTAIEAANAAEEAQIIALAMRRALATPGRTAALVTPDRALARRVAALCRRWNLNVDDSAGTPLRLTPPGALALAITEAMAQGFSPTPLLAVLKHPLVESGDNRGQWLAATRRLDLALRGVRPPPGLDAVGEALDAAQAEQRRRTRNTDTARLADLQAAHAEQSAWWQEVAQRLEPVARLAESRQTSLPDLAAALRTTGNALCHDRLWSGPDGRALAALIDDLEVNGGIFGRFDHDEAPALIAALLSDIAVRPAYGGHPRLAILGPLEAQLQRADLMILGGLNEGIWPGRPAPDPWLAPAIRRSLALPGLARATGLAAHDFVGGMGAAEVLLTRARRDASAPLVASRFWLRIQAFSGGIAPADDLLRIARAIDHDGAPLPPAAPPRPAPPANRRPDSIAVTEIDTLMADPFAFYARNILRLRPLDPLDDDPNAQTRGNRIHKVMERWIGGNVGSLELLAQITEEELAAEGRQFPLLRALWAPRARRALAWAGAEVHRREAEGWTTMQAEAGGEMRLDNGITLRGRADRVDRNAAGDLAVIDYKTGSPPSTTQVRAGFANQLGLLMAMAARGVLRTRAAPVLPGMPLELAWWKMGGGTKPGEVRDALKGNPPLTADDHVGEVLARAELRTSLLLRGDAPFVPKLNPGLSWGDYDHLARVAEWLDRPK